MASTIDDLSTSLPVEIQRQNLASSDVDKLFELYPSNYSEKFFSSGVLESASFPSAVGVSGAFTQSTPNPCMIR